MIKSYEEMSLAVYKKLSDLMKEKDNDLAIVALLSGKTEDELLDMPLAEYEKLREQAGFLAYEPKMHSVQNSYKVGDMTLVPLRKTKNISTAQYIDCKEYIKMGGDLEQMLSVFLIPEGHKYNDGYDVEDVQKAILSMGILDIISLQCFFLTRLEKLTLDSLTSLEQKMKIMPESVKKMIQTQQILVRRVISAASGGGSGKLMPFPSLLVQAGRRFI